MISTAEHPKKFIDVLGKKIAYVEMGSGDPIVFVHGNPTSSYLWRNIMSRLSALGRCISIDLIGMGDSEKLDGDGRSNYRFITHRSFFENALKALGVNTHVTLVIHDWGSALGFHWAKNHPNAVRGIAYMEAIVKPMTWRDWPEASQKIFKSFRSDDGEAMILDNNVFVERVLPASVMRKLSEEEMAVYRRPFAEPGEGRRPTLTWPREIPLDGQPADVVEICEAYSVWLAENDIPKLFVNADPGAILVGPQREFCRTWKNQKEVTVKGSHFIQEDSPDEISDALVEWMASFW